MGASHVTLDHGVEKGEFWSRETGRLPSAPILPSSGPARGGTGALQTVRAEAGEGIPGAGPAAGHEPGSELQFFFSKEDARQRLGSLRDQARTLQDLLRETSARKIDPAYPLLSATVLDNFVGYALEDLEHNEVKRAFEHLAALEPMAQRAQEQLRDALAGRVKLPEAPRYVTSPITISGPSFIAQTATGREETARTHRPVFFVGHGAFGQVRADLEKLPAYGVNIIQIEFGPSSVSQPTV
jgi:hypothetical protein